MERLLERFRQAHTQVLGISVDSIYCHANWGRDLGGISFPLLADFHPKGAVASSFGLYLEDKGITDRATVIIDASGMVRHVSSVTPSGQRNIEELAALCEVVDKEYGKKLAEIPRPPGLAGEAALYIKSRCGFSRAVLLARDNLHLQDQIREINVTDNTSALEDLKRLTQKTQVPCLVNDGKPMLESADIIRHFVGRMTDLQ